MSADRFVETTPSAGSFALVQGKAAATIYVDAADWEGVARAAGDLQADIERATGVKPVVTSDESKWTSNERMRGLESYAAHHIRKKFLNV